MELLPGITLIPLLHGRAAFSTFVRNLCNNNKYDCIAVDIPDIFSSELTSLVNELPGISAVTAQPESQPNAPIFYIPTDPCDPMIEGIRQAVQKRIPCMYIGYPELYKPAPLPPLPDEYAIHKLGFYEYATLCIHALNEYETVEADERAAQYCAFKLHELRLNYRAVLACIHFRHLLPLIRHFKEERTFNLSFKFTEEYALESFSIHPDHLYFALGELPFVTGVFEKERQDIFAEPVDIVTTIKDLFCKTRDDYFDRHEDTVHLSPVRIQSGITFLRNLTVMEKRFIPSLFDIVAAAKGIGGNAYAVRILKSAKYYPYLSFDTNRPTLAVGIDQVLRPDRSVPDDAVNLFRDTRMIWKTLSIKPDPSELRKKKYRYHWNPYGMCSHIPEDRRIENFNTHVRTRARQALCEDRVKTERFETSIKDGVDIRETLRNWYTGDIYVKEIPPSRGAVDTVVIIFDEDHDTYYPYCSTWYAEHDQESTLTFYATDPFADLIGPGVARCKYGGVSLLFPPRHIPGVFEIPEIRTIKKLSRRLTYGALLFSKENSVAYVASKKPDFYLRRLAARMKKHLVWIPLAHFSTETLRKLKQFHVLNGKEVRSWAGRFIGE